MCAIYRSIFNHYNAISPKSIEFDEITQNKGYYTVQDHPRSPMSVPIESPYDFLLVINTICHLISYRFEVIADYCSNFGHFAFWGLRRNVHGSYIGSLERAYSGLPINDNWTFFAKSEYWLEIGVFEEGWPVSTKIFTYVRDVSRELLLHG